MFRYLRFILVGNKRIFICAVLFLALLSLDGIGAPYFLGKFTDYMNNSDFDSSMYTVFLWLIFLLLIVLSKFLFIFFKGKFIQNVNYQLKNIHAVNSVSKENLQQSPSSYITSITSEVQQIENKFINNVFTMMLCTLQGVVTFIFLMNINVLVGLLFVGLGAIPALIPKLTKKWLKKGTIRWQESNDQYIGFLTDFLEARQLMKRFGVVNNVLKKLNEKLGVSEKNYFKMDFNQNIANTIIGLLYVCSLLIALMLGISSVQNGYMTVGSLLTIYMAADRVVTPLITAASTYNVIQSIDPILNKVLTLNSKAEEYEQLLELPTSREVILEFKQTTVGYQDNELIKNIDFSLGSHDKILFKAPSGSGKSTFLKTILGETQVLSGTINYGQEQGIELFSVVSQHPFIFDETLLFNLTFDSPIDESRVIEILRRVGMKHLATKEMLHTKMDKQLHSLSGGELKRLELARALLFEKPCLLVDEALSGLDNESSKILNDLIKTYSGAVIDIEHHISEEMMVGYDKIITIKDNHLVINKMLVE